MIVMLLPAADYDPTESALAWRELTAAGIEVRFATPEGVQAFADERLVQHGFSILSPMMMTRPGALDAYRHMTQDPNFAKPLRYQDIDVDQLDGLFVPGGHAGRVRTLLESPDAHAVMARAMLRDLPVGAVCHGVLVAARATDPATGRSVLYGRRTTALTSLLELSAWTATRAWLGDYYRTYPQTVQQEVTAVLAAPTDFEPGPLLPWRDSPTRLQRGFTVHDGNYLSARWPGDCHRLAREYLALVRAHRRRTSNGDKATGD